MDFSGALAGLVFTDTLARIPADDRSGLSPRPSRTRGAIRTPSRAQRPSRAPRRRALRGAKAASPGASARRRKHPGEQTGLAEHELLMAERHAALREAFTRLPPRCQRLLTLLIEDSPVPYAKISTTLGISVGSIGSSRSRCLEKLRRDPAIAALINPEARSTAGETRGQLAAQR